MNYNRRDGIPAFVAAAVLFAAALIEDWITVTGKSGYHIDTIFNIIFIGIAILGGILIGLPAKRQNDRKVMSLLSNLLVSILAFPMNIAVFGHKINWSDPLKNLWGGHIGWLFCSILQILCLSKLGEQLMYWVQRLPMLVIQTIAAIAEFIKKHDKIIILIITIDTVIWTMFLTCKVCYTGIYETLTISTFADSLFFWIICALIDVVVYTIPFILKGLSIAIKDLDSKKILFLLMVAVVSVALYFTLPFVLETMGFWVTALVVPLGLIGLIIGNITYKTRRLKKKGAQPYINSRDMTVVLLAFFVIPLLFLNTTTVLSDEGQKIIKQDPVTMKTYIDYIIACCNTASSVMQLFA